jgi:hypothetical protein
MQLISFLNEEKEDEDEEGKERKGKERKGDAIERMGEGEM